LALDDARLPTNLVPNCAIVLRNIADTARTFDPARLEDLPGDITRAVPFAHLLFPAVLVARGMLCSRLKLRAPLQYPILGIISENAYTSVERSLLNELSDLSGRTLEYEFRRSQPYGKSLLLMFEVRDPAQSGNARYRAFVRGHLQSGLLKLFSSYPVLGRLIATMVVFWSEAIAELFSRLVEDRRALVDRFRLSAATPVQVFDLKLSLSDRHRRGRTVALVKFFGGDKLIYKPKSLSIEAKFNELLRWCNTVDITPQMRVTNILDRGDYGWAEYVEQKPCTHKDDADRFYVRAGMLLCLLYVLRATDCHYENVVAHADHPVLIDAETLLYPDPCPLDDSAPFEAGELLVERLHSDSVLRTGMLPRWQSDANEATAHDISALGCTSDQPAPRTGLRWKCINTDDMHTRYEAGTMRAGHNVAKFGEKVLSVLDYEAELMAGFERMYRFLLLHRKALLASSGPLAAMQHESVRFIYRPTRIYRILTGLGWDPRIQTNGIDYGIHLEQLARAFLTVGNKPVAWPVLSAEIHATEQMDVPVFCARVSGRTLYADDGTTVLKAFNKPSYDATIELLQRLCESDLAHQLAIIRATLSAKAQEAFPVSTIGDPEARAAVGPLLDRRALISEATAIGTQIEERALPDGKHGVNWIGLGYMEQADRFQVSALNASLYNGCGGVAVFLAALSAVTGENRFASLALQSLEVLRKRLATTQPQLRNTVARAYGLGAAAGLGSIIYSFVRTASFLDSDFGLLEDACAVANWLTPEVIAADDKLDLLSGAGGALLSLLCLYSAKGAAKVLDVAAACGDHLVLRRTLSAGGHCAWKTVAGCPLTGLSHGAAGISYALLRLYGVRPKPAYLEAATDGIEFERSLFSEQHCNWPDLRGGGDEPGFPVRWCHGAAGIGLARLGCRKIMELQGLDSEIAMAVGTTLKHYVQDTDHLCCGNFGRAETLLVAAHVFGRGDWRRAAEQGVAEAVGRMAGHGSYRLFAAKGVYNPTLFQGTSGIGYQLLRFASPELPSLLLWE
jgi:type 2 lantibiotic biosynthesis protein LanM